MRDAERTAAVNLVQRREPMKRLVRNAHARLVVVHGPAGFGKTTLLRQYRALREEAGGRVVWVDMDSHAADPAHFVRLLGEALEPDFGPHGPPAASIPEILRRAARDGRDLTIILDDFETAASAGLGAALNQLLRALPERGQLCIGTRTVPAVNLSRLQVLDQAIVLRADELRFRPSETVEFFRPFQSLSPEEVARIHDSAEGWPAALQCIRLCLRDGRLRHGLASPAGDVAPELITYLAATVFDGLADTVRNRLLHACLPERINPDLLVHLTGDEAERGRLEDIERLGLFLAPDGSGVWYRFHNVFRRFLLARVARELPADALRDRHRRVAVWLAANGQADDAVLHFLEAGDPETAATTLAGIVDRLVAEERLGLIVRCVDRIPAEVLRRHENLLHAAGIAYAFRREFAKADAIVDLLRRVLEERGGGPVDWGFHNFVRVFVLAAQDRIAEMGEVAAEMMSQLRREHGFTYAVAFNARAFALAARGDFDGARDALRTARPLHDESGSLFGQAYQEAISATLHSSQGRLEEALGGLKTALRRVEEDGASCCTAGAVIGAYLSEALYERNRLTEAERHLDDFARSVEQEAIVDPLAVTLQTVARIALARGDADTAAATMERAIYLGHRHGLPRLVRYARAELARQATLAGDVAAARLHLDAMPEDEQPGMTYFASEAEAQDITAIRLQIAMGRHGEARAAIQAHARRARAGRRNRRLLKLTLLLAVSLNAEGQTSAARRALITALELGQPGTFIRSFLDEGPAAIRLLRDTAAALPRTPGHLRRDPVESHLRRLLAEAGENLAPDLPLPDVLLPDVLMDKGWAEEDRAETSPQLFERLTERERDILRLVASGLPNKALAERLSLSSNTVKWHMRNIFEKLHIASRMQAVVVARHFGLID